MFKGIPASNGLGLAKALIITEKPLEINKSPITEDDIEHELKRFNDAIALSSRQLDMLYESAKQKLGAESEIIQAQIEMLCDPFIQEEVEQNIKNGLRNAEHSVEIALDEQISILSAVEDEYIKERAMDLVDIKIRLLHILTDTPLGLVVDEESVLICDVLTPSQTANLQPEHIKGIICKSGGVSSHAAIIARSMDIPAIMGCKGFGDVSLKNGDMVFINGSKGEAFVVTDESQIDSLRIDILKAKDMKIELLALKDAPINKPVSLFENVGSLEEYQNMGDGIGLFRTEFLYMEGKKAPTEDAQFAIYKQAVEKLAGKKLVIRTFDIGGDKEVPYLKIPKEDNPFLGWRAVRVCLDMPDLFTDQLRSLLRASAFGNLSIMIPMISSVAELRAVKKIFEEVKADLRQRGIAFDEEIELGIMIEIPAAAICADSLIKEADFFSIGTNDLIQYTLAVDRGNDKVASYYDFFNPAVLRLVKMTIDASHKVGKTTSMCGETAGDPLATLLLLGMGLDGFSMSAAVLPKIKKIILETDMHFVQEAALAAMEMGTSEEVRKFLTDKLGELELDYLILL